MDEGSVLEGDIRVNASLRFPVGDNVFHLQLELPGDCGLGIPALSQKHPDGIRDPRRCGIRGPPGSFPVLYLLQHNDVSVPAKWSLAG